MEVSTGDNISVENKKRELGPVKQTKRNKVIKMLFDGPIQRYRSRKTLNKTFIVGDVPTISLFP